MNVDLEGTIHPTSLPSLLYSVCASRETGQILLRRDAGPEKNVYLKDGGIIFATSNNRDERLGQMLLRKGVVGVEWEGRRYTLTLTEDFNPSLRAVARRDVEDLTFQDASLEDIFMRYYDVEEDGP